MPRREEWTHLDTCARFYVNSAQIATSSHDVRLRMGVVAEADESLIVSEAVADVFMSRPHALALLERLAQTLGVTLGAPVPESVGTMH